MKKWNDNLITALKKQPILIQKLIRHQQLLFFLQIGCLFILLIMNPQAGYSQENKQQHKIVFEGYILSQDSLPVENAFLINYRTAKIITTNADGYFKTSLLSGDSLMVNHLNLTPTVLHVDSTNARGNKFYIATHTYEIGPVHSSERTMQQKYATENLTKIKNQAKKPTLREIKSQTGNDNSYDDANSNPGIHILSVPLTKLKITKKKHQP